MYFRQTRWVEFFAAWLSILGMYCIGMLVNILLGSAIGAMGGWLVSRIFLGNWIIAGLHSVGINVSGGDLYALGAAAGFGLGLTKGHFAIGPLKRPERNAFRDNVDNVYQ